MNKVHKKLNYDNCCSVDRIGLNGGLALLWKSSCDLQVSFYSKHHIDVVIKQDKRVVWRFTSVYEHPEKRQKKRTWELLRRLHSILDLPWLCSGDFNEVLSLNAKNEGIPSNLDSMADFREVIKECNFIDLRWKGPPFTWSNRRLDRLLCNLECHEIFK